MHPLDILLVKPGSQRQLYGKLAEVQLTALEPPFWAALLAGYLRRLGFGVDILDAEVEGLSPRETAERICDAAPHLTAVVVSGTNPSASTMNMVGAAAMIDSLREQQPEMRVLLMGLHPSALPARTMQEERVDFVCQGEGFHTLPKLLQALRSRATTFAIEGLWYRLDGKIIDNPRPDPFDDLDRLPMPAWDLLSLQNYRAHNWHCFDDISGRQPYAVLYTSLGCPYRCDFCCINTLFGRSGIRFRAAEKVIEELDYLVGHAGVRNIKIMDEMFALKEDRVIDLCERIAERDYDLNMWAYARVSAVTAPMLAAMKRAGINWVAYGFESANARVLRGVSKGYNPDVTEGVVRMTDEEGIYICANYIFGLPDDNYDTMQESLAAMMKINAQWANIYSTMALPGSALFASAMAEGAPLPEAWAGFSQYAYDCLPLQTRHLSGGQVLAFRDYAFDAYYKNPRYLDMIRRTFGQNALDHIVGMTARRISRKHAHI